MADPLRALLLGDPTADGLLARLLDRAGLAVTGAADPAAATALLADSPQDLAVVPVGTGGTGRAAGPDTVAALVEAAPSMPVLALVTADGPGEAALAVVGAGATSVVLTPGELPDAARRTAEGTAVFSPGLADLVLESAARSDPADAGRLTDREADVLRLVVDGLTARQIASRLVLSPRTVENHVQNMLRKLRLTGRAALVRYAIENGLA